MAKKKPDPPPTKRLRNILALRGTDDWKEWLDELAEANHAPLTVTVEQALGMMADRLKVRKPPKRIP